ncbi:MAG: tRNA (adenosine(37)-N6)-dimethylallyltransferase MiaA [Fretibacterium sp.]|nr:tRNA (adenosine(37)-N6)-dimethylallyltransferase MiaA [Fretibacterium sp.]
MTAEERQSVTKPLPVAAIIGPTAVGKTALSLELARRLNAEIISVDSRQVYRYMDIGTDKISHAARREVLHHSIDVVDPDEVFTVASFANLALEAVERIRARGRRVLFVGGTPFYYHALFHASMNVSLPRDAEARRRYEEMAKQEGAESLHRKLAEVDAESAHRLHPNDVRRVSRALEIWEASGIPPSRLYKEGAKADSGLNVLYIGLTRPRIELSVRIANRASRQFASGYPEEVAWLIENGFDERFPSMQGFGYKELSLWYRGEKTLEEALERDISRTRAFCRRQMTWFLKFKPALWYDSSVLSMSFLRRKIYDTASRHLDGV